MSNNLETLNQIITSDDNNDILIEHKLREKEKYKEKLDKNNSNNNSEKKGNRDNEINDSNKKIVIEIKIENCLNSNSQNEINSNENITI